MALNLTVHAAAMMPKAANHNEVALAKWLVHSDLQAGKRMNIPDTIWPKRFGIDELLIVSKT